MDKLMEQSRQQVGGELTNLEERLERDEYQDRIERFKQEVEAEIRRRAEPWARAFDGNSLIVLRRASVGFDTRPMFKDIKAKVLYVLSSTDRVFPPEIAPRTMDALKAAGVDATYVLVDSIHGHSGATVDADKWLPDLKAFMDRVAPPPNAKPR